MNPPDSVFTRSATASDGPPAETDVAMPEPVFGVDGVVQPAADAVPVVGLGGSAGSFEALQEFLSRVPPGTVAAYVVVVHLAPEHESILADILQKRTKLKVRQINTAVKVESGHVYVIPPGKLFAMADGILQALDMKREKGRHVTVDLFFRTLAETHGPLATAIVLSGGDGDGAIGIKRIKERGGLTIAQDPAEAEHDGMPRSAVATGMVDWILPVLEMPDRLAEYWENGRKLRLPETESPPDPRPVRGSGESDEAALRKVLAFLQARTGHDFDYYKRATILRRVGRRMQVNGSGDLKEYLAFLRTHPGEAGALLQDLLISVTNFFRDKDAFQALENIIPELFKNRSTSDQIRVWVPACATGEEAYSIAILLAEYAGGLTHPPKIQVFATDLDQSAIEVAREGRYQETIVADVSEERIRRFFTKEEGAYRVRKEIREMVLFAMHDLLRDSPFSRLDLVSCRNLLIYLDRNAQAKVFDIFHFALHPDGYLFLGTSESAEEATTLFASYYKKNRLYSRRALHRTGVSVPAGAATLAFPFQGRHRLMAASAHSARMLAEGDLPEGESPGPLDWGELHLKLIEHVSPPSVVVNVEHDIVHISKKAGRYMKVAGGEPTINLLRLVHPDLRTELRAALFRATKTDARIRIPNIPAELEGQQRLVDLTIEPVGDLTRDFFLVVFEDHGMPATPESGGPGEVRREDMGLVQHLEDELAQLRSTWKESMEQYEASGEELKASNEELHAMNEELRSATEELETGREELQSINEEVTTINQELKSKLEELGRANSDLQNLMASTKIATIFLDRGLCIKRFTPSTRELFNFIPSDLGRPLSDVTHRLDYPDIARDAEEVLGTLAVVEREVRNVESRWYLIRMSPYRTIEDNIAGVVITCVDITDRKRNEESRRWLSSIVEASNDAIISFTMDGHIVSWNQGAEQIFGYTAGDIVGRSQAILAPPELQEEKAELLEKLRAGKTIGSFETVRLRKDGQKIDVSLSASVMRDEAGEIVGATAIARDITVRKRAVEELRQARNELEARVEQRTAELARRVTQLARMAAEVTSAEQRERKRLARILHDELQQLLVSAKMRIESLHSLDAAARSREVENLALLMEEMLTSSRSLAIDLSPPVLAEGLGPSLEWLALTWMKEKHGLEVRADLDLSLDAAKDETRSLVFFAVKELLFNVVKHSRVSEARLRLAAGGPGELRVTVRDHGIGFDGLAGIPAPAASGLGLTGLAERLEMLGGRLEIRTRPGDGVKAVITVPMKD